MKNAYFPFLIVILFFSHASIHAQIRWSAGLDIDFLQDAKVTGSKTVTDIRFDYWRQDSLKGTYEDTRNIEFYNKYAQLGKGIKAYGLVHIPISPKFNLVTGLGVDISTFYVNTVNTKIDLTEKLLKTEKVDVIPIHSHWNPEYPKYPLNDIWNHNDDITLLNLYIPIELDYKLTNNLRVFAGGKINTPIYAKYNSYHKETKLDENGATVSTETIKDHSKDAIKTVTFEGIGGLKYRIFDRYELSFSASKHFTNIFRQPTQNEAKDVFQNIDFTTFKPVKFSVGVSYFFN